MNGSQQTSFTSPVSFFLEDGLDLKKMLMQLYHQKKIIVAVALLTGFIAFIHTFSMHPQYQSSAILQVHPPSSGTNVLSKLGYKGSGDSAIQTQQALIKTRYILEPVVVQTGLNIAVTPRYFPYFGEWKAKRFSGKGIAPPLFGLKSYAWGGESIEVKSFSVRPDLLGQTFRLVAGQNNQYQLFTSDNKLILTGKIGELQTSKIYNLQLELSNLIAHPGTEFFISEQPPISQVKRLSRSLTITDLLGNDTTQNTGIFQLTLTDSDPIRLIKTLNGIANFAVLKNKQQNALEAQKTLEFLSKRLPELKNNLAEAENAMNQYHIKNTTLSMSMISQLLLRQLSTMEANIEKIRSQREELLQLYTPEHPLVIGSINKEAALVQRLKELKEEVRKFPLINQEEINLQREVKIKNQTYLYLLNSQQQLEIAKAGLSSDISVLSEALPATQIPMHKFLFILMGLLLGTFGTSLIILVKNALNKTIEDSDQIENALKIPVQTVLPYSRKQKQMEKTHEKGLNTLGTGLSAPLILASQEPDDITIESLRSLRVSIQFMSTKHQVIALMGSLAGIGKSFVSINLAQVFADNKKRTLLIDADIRRGRLHKTLLQPKSNGLSEYLESKCGYEDGLIRHINENLYFIPSGSYATHPIQLFQNQLFGDLIEKVKHQFDQIIIDTPPVLPVTDGILIAQHCDIKLFVVSAGSDTIDDVKKAVKKAQAHHIEINGMVLNHRKSLAGSSAYEYRYTYTKDMSPA